MNRTPTRVEIDGRTYFVRKVSLGGRKRIQQATQGAMFSGRKIDSGRLRELAKGDNPGAAIMAELQSGDIDLSAMFGQAENQAAALIAECICIDDVSGLPMFSSAEDVLEGIDADEADRMVQAINSLSPTPINPTAEDVQAIAGNSEATG